MLRLRLKLRNGLMGRRLGRRESLTVSASFLVSVRVMQSSPLGRQAVRIRSVRLL